MATADHAIRAGAARHALVIGAEKMSDITDWNDRTSCVLLGDGAGAAVLSADPDEHVGPVVWGSDPAMGNAVRILGDWHPMFAQDGQTVFRWATTALAPLARQACERAGIEPRDLGAIVTHQANLRIIEAIVARLDVPDVLVATDVVESGNTSAASIPIALSKMLARNEIRPGAKALLFGFGGGLSWAGQVVTCH
jgi:3-oxoacyl-[acyl-carrier-protein] synthase-3